MSSAASPGNPPPSESDITALSDRLESSWDDATALKLASNLVQRGASLAEARRFEDALAGMREIVQRARAELVT